MNKILKKINGLLVTLSLTTMVFSPVAMGEQAKENADRVSKTQLEQFVKEYGLNKSMTVGEFYQKAKDQFPPRIQKMIEPLMTQFKNEPMPQFEVSQVKNSQGESIATLRISNKDQLSTIQFVGEEGKYVKFDNTYLSEDDIVNFDDMFKRLYYGDANHRKGMGEAQNSIPSSKQQSGAVASPTKFSGLPKINQQMWKKMTPMERAQFMVNMRLLWSGAEAVLDANKPQKSAKEKGKKTSALDKWNSFLSMISEAQADESTKCVVAGYIGEYGKGSKGSSCEYPEGIDKTDCKFPCSETIYGFDPAGKRFCLKNSIELQTATHFNKGCDKLMPLNSSLLAPTSTKKDSTRYDGLTEINKAKALADPKMQENTKKYLKSMLAKKNSKLADAFEKGTIDAELLKELVTIQSEFDGIIGKARTDCQAAADEKKQKDKNFWGACDQLHARFLFVSAYLEKTPGCSAGTIDPETLTCSCPDGMPAVLPGAKCESKPIVQPPPPTSGGTPVTPPQGSGKCDPACKSDETCKETDDGKGVKDYSCVSKNKPDKKKSGGGFWGFIKKLAPWVLGAGALFLVYKLFSPKKPKLNPAGDVCANGTIPPCGSVTCTAPKALLANGGCACAACPPGQTLTNASTCQCDQTATTTTLYVCADGVTQVSNLANCPATATYTCWDGSKVSNPINCPEQTTTNPTTKPVETGR